MITVSVKALAQFARYPYFEEYAKKNVAMMQFDGEKFLDSRDVSPLVEVLIKNKRGGKRSDVHKNIISRLTFLVILYKRSIPLAIGPDNRDTLDSMYKAWLDKGPLDGKSKMTDLNAMPTIPPKDTTDKYKEIAIDIQDEDTSVNLISKYNEYIARFGLEKNHEDLNSIIALAQKLDASCNYIVNEDSIEVKADEGITTSIIGYYFINKVISKQNEN